MDHERAAGDLLRTARAKAGMTQRELAAAGSMSQSMVAAYESGRRQPSLPVLWRLIGAAGYEARVRLAPPDQQSTATASWEASRLEHEQGRWREEQDRVSARRR